MSRLRTWNETHFSDYDAQMKPLPVFSQLPLVLLAGSLGLALTACNGGKGDSIDTSGTNNASPVLTLDSPVQDALYEGSYEPAEPNVTVTGFVVDEEDAASILVLSFLDAPDGDLGTLTISDDGTFSGAFTLTDGPHALGVTVTDSGGLSSTVSVGFDVDVPTNAAPEITLLDVTPAEPHAGDTLVASVEVSDEDEDPWTATFQWVETASGVTVDGDTVTDVVLGEEWTVTAVVNDEHVDSEPSSRTVTVVNAPPSAEGVTVTPPSGTPEDTFVCAADNVTDLDGDAVTTTYRWLLEGAELAVGDTLTPDLAAGRVVKHADLVCEASMTDDLNTTIQTSSVVDVVNRSPDLPVVSVTPTEPVDTDDLSCAATTDDIDGDAITWTWLWSRDGVATSHATSSLPASDTHKDDVWTCTATADDGDGGSSSADSSVVIDNVFQSTGDASDADVVIDGQTSGGAFGKTIALVGDTDGDGLSDLLVGANSEAGGGRMYLFNGPSLTGSVTTADAIASWANSEAGAQLGGYRCITAPGDLDGDGFSELFFAAALSDANGEDSGETYLFYGGGTFAVDQSLDTADWNVRGVVNDYAGTRLTAGDLDGDGVGDIVIAAPGASDESRQSGTIGVFYGTGARWSGTANVADADYSVMGLNDTDELGWTTKFVGDVDADGIDDLFTTAMYGDDGGSDAGVGGLISGGSYSGSDLLTDAATAIFTGDGPDDRFGYDAVGYDADGDSVNDLLVGEYQDDTNGVDSGTLRVYFGQSRWASGYSPSDADVTVLGGAAGDRFAHVLQDAGDVDGDGADDLLIGALFADPDGRENAGSAYLSLGGDILASSDASTLEWRRDGQGAGDLFGDAVAFGSGDVDGDGADEIVVGAQGYDGGAADAGRVYIWLGKP